MKDWEKGEWLKGMGLSGSQAEYILDFISSLLDQQREEIRGKVEGLKKVGLYMKASDEFGVWEKIRKEISIYNQAIDDILELLNK